MRKAVITQDELAKIAKWEKKVEKYGTDQPFVGIQDTWKVGRRHMRKDEATLAKLVLASDLELRAHTLLKFKLKQPRFKTQVPLLPLSATLDIANELGVLHSRDWETNSAKTMSTDIVVEGVDRETGELREIAVFVRYTDGLYKVVNGERHPIKRE